MTRPIHRPIIWLTISMIIGIIGGEAWPSGNPWIFVPVSALLAVLTLCLIRKVPVMLLPLLLFGGIGYLSIQPWASPRFPDHHIRHLADSQAYQITGTVLDEPVVYGGRTRFDMEAVSVMQGGKPAPICGRLRVTVSDAIVHLSRGDGVSFVARIRSIRNFNNPGGFDYKRHMAFQRIWVRSYVAAEKLSIRPGKIAGGRSLLANRRAMIAEMIDAAAMDTPGREQDVKAVSKALLIGDRKGISSLLREKFNRAGVGHLLAISGLHLGIVAGAAFAVFRWLAAWFSPILWAGWTRKTAAVLTFVPVLAYGFLAGMSPSTQRAAAMVSVFLLTLLLDRDQDLTNTLCIAGMVILAINPTALFSISFQLSFTAVLVILYGMSMIRPLLPKRKGIRANLVAKGIAFVAVTLFATIGTAPLVMTYFNQISFVGIMANVVVIPLVGFLAVPLGLTAVLFQMVSAGAGSACLQLSHRALEKAISVIDFFSGLPMAALETITPTVGEIGLFYLMLSGIVIWFDPRHREKQSRPQIGLKRGIALGMILLAAVGGVLDAGYWLHQRFWHRDLRVTIFDVGQGSAALLELPGGRNLLMDGGGFSDNAVFDTGKNIIAPYLLQHKIKTIHTLFLSHPNSDHLNGLIYIAGHFNVKRTVTNNESSPTKGYRLFIEALETHGIDTPRYRALKRSTTFGGVKLEVLFPPKDFLDRIPRDKWRNQNDNSLVLKVSFGRHSFLFPGDITAAGEQALVAAAGDKLKSTVLLSPHHGSKSSSTPLLMERVDPEIVVVSCGWMNQFHFPAKTVLERYKAKGAEILRTDINGAIRLWTDGREMKIRTTLTKPETPDVTL